jgi:hypothetical protein
LISDRIIEITEEYNIYLDGVPFFSPSLDDIVDDITKDYSGNYIKASKRMFSVLKLKSEEPRKQDILLDYFNSPEGLVYRCKHDLETMYLVWNTGEPTTA